MVRCQSLRLAATLLVVLLTACSSLAPTPQPATTAEPPASGCPSCPLCPPCAAAAAAPGVPAQGAAKALAPARWSDLPSWRDDDLLPAWPAFLRSCTALAKRPQWADWKAACEAAKTLQPAHTAAIRHFFETRFQPWRVTNPDGTTNGLITGYYEPLVRGSRTRGKPYLQPVLGVPPDLLTIDLEAVMPELKNLRLRGRLDERRRVVPYYARAEIASREQEHADRALLWVDDPIELFFLQVQGSGRVLLADGKTTRLAYADHNGHPYQSIGRILVERGELTSETATMQGIKQWARANPSRVTELLNKNPSYVFFREQAIAPASGDGPNGALAVALTAERSIAVDPRHVPLGAPVFLATTYPDSPTPWRRLVLAQDTGGAIRGAVRADVFWGAGAAAGQHAGRMRQQGQMWVLLPAGAAAK